MFYQCYVLPMLFSIQSTVGLIAPFSFFHGTFFCRSFGRDNRRCTLPNSFAAKTQRQPRRPHQKRVAVDDVYIGRRCVYSLFFVVYCCSLFILCSLFFVPGVIHSSTSLYRLCNLIEVVDTLHRQPQPVSDAAARSKGVVVRWGGWFGARDFRVCHGLVCQWWC